MWLRSRDLMGCARDKGKEVEQGNGVVVVGWNFGSDLDPPIPEHQQGSLEKEGLFSISCWG